MRKAIIALTLPVAALLSSGVALADNADLWRDYEKAIRLSAVHGRWSQVWLKTIPADQQSVTMGTFTEWGVPSSPVQRYTWVSLPQELQAKCQGKSDAVLAIQEVLGLPPQAMPSRPDHKWQVIRFTVSRADLFRPCPGGTDVSVPSCAYDTVDKSLDPAITAFFLNQMWTSYRLGKSEKAGPGYPYTGMGWTYDWDPASRNHVGVSEFVVKPGSAIQNPTAMSPEEFCKGTSG